MSTIENPIEQALEQMVRNMAQKLSTIVYNAILESESEIVVWVVTRQERTSLLRPPDPFDPRNPAVPITLTRIGPYEVFARRGQTYYVSEVL